MADSMFDGPEGPVTPSPANAETLPTRRVADAQPPATQSPMQMMQTLIDRGADPSQLGEIAQLARQWKEWDAEEAFNESLAAVQAELPVIRKVKGVSLTGGKVTHHYCPYEYLWPQVEPILTKHGIQVSFRSDTHSDDALGVVCILSRGIHSREYPATVRIPKAMRVNETQQDGAALSYAKRYALSLALNLVFADEDTDGQTLVEPITDAEAAAIEDLVSQLPKQRQERFWKAAGCAAAADIPRAEYAQRLAQLKTVVASL